MKKIVKALAFVLSFAMLVSLAPMSVLASEQTNSEQTTEVQNILTDDFEALEENTAESETEKAVAQETGDSESSKNELSGGEVIEVGGTYTLKAGATGTITIATTEAVTIAGAGAEWDENYNITSNAYSGLGFAASVAGINLTLKDMYIKNTDDTQPIVDVTGTENKLGVEGTVLLEQTGTDAGTYAAIHVSKGNNITINGTGTLYLYKSSGGAGVGGNSGELNGDITFGDSKSSLKVFMKGSKQGAVIGAGAGASQESETPGFVKFVEGEYNLISNSRGAVIGGSAGSTGATDGTTVYVEKKANININTDWTGAAIGGGGYDKGNDASGGMLYIDGGSLRVYIDGNAVKNTETTGWKGKEYEQGVNDTSITAQRLNSNGENVYRLVLDTSAVDDISAPYTVTVDGETVYIGGNHHYGFVQEGLDKKEQLKITSTPSNWYSITEPNLYLYVTGKDHTININGVDVKYCWDKDTETFSAENENPVNIVVTDGTNNITKNAEITLSEGMVYTYTEKTYQGIYEDGSDEAAEDDSAQVSAETTPHQLFNVAPGVYTLTIKADGYYGSSFSFKIEKDGTITDPNGNSERNIFDYFEGSTFTIPLTKFTPSTNTGAWDGKTLDVSWYTEDGDNFEITTAEQLAGLAAIVNGIYNVEVTTIKDGDKTYTPEEYAALETRKIRTACSKNDINKNNQVTTDDYWYGVKSDGKTPSDFNGKSIYIKADIDMGGYEVNGAWTGARYMTIGGQSLMHYIDYGAWKSDGYTHIGSSFNGKLYGEDHIIKNIYCDRYAAGSSYGDSESVGLIGRIGNHDNDSADIAAVNPTVRDIAVSGYVYGRRSVGGVVGKIGKTSASEKKDGSVGGIIENCLNFCEVHNTDSKGCGGIVGAGWNKGRVKNCANFGYIWTTYSCPTGGISGSNEVKLINCYNVGIIKADDASRAMAIGTNNSGASTVTNCYWLTGTPDSKAGYYKGSGDIEITDNYKGTSYTAAEYMKTSNFTTELNGTGRTWVIPDSETLIYQFMKEQGFEGYPVPRIFTTDTTTLVSVEKVSDPTKLSYIEEQTFDPTGLVIKATYSDGTSEEIEDYTISKISALETTDTKITISGTVGETDFSYDFDITVAEKECTGLVIMQKPNSLVYTKDDMTVDTDGLIVGARYNNNPQKVMGLDSSDYTVRFSKNENEEDCILISYVFKDKTFTETIDITVLENEKPSQNEEGYYELTCSDDLVWFANEVTAKGNVELNAKIMNDFTVGDEFSGIGSESKVYKGKIDGNNCTVTINKETKSKFGFVNFADGVEIKDLTIAGAITQTEKDDDTAAFVAQLYTANITDAEDEHMTVIENCCNLADITSTGSNVAGFVGNVNRGSLMINGCVNEGNISGTQNAGGIVGTAKSALMANGETTVYFTKKIEIVDCKNKGNITANESNVGGITGNFDSRNSKEASRISGCQNEGTVSGSNNVGGIVGYIYGLSSNAENIPVVEKCGNDGTVTGAYAVGGIAGYNTGVYLKIDSCYNSGAVEGTGSDYGVVSVGGIMGACYTQYLTNVYNYGNVTGGVKEGQKVSASSGVGGIVGISNAVTGSLKNAYNAGAVTTTETDTTNAPNMGAIVGYTVGNFTASNVYMLKGTADNACGKTASKKTFSINDNAVKTASELKKLAGTLGEGFETNPTDSYHEGYPMLAGEHEFEDVEVAKKATCTTDGIEKMQCKQCGLEASRTIKATGHTEVNIPGVPATYTSTGLTEGIKCSACGTILKKQEVIPMLMTDGWHNIGGKYYFYKNNVVQKGWVTDNGKKYYTDATTGIRVEGLKKISGFWYYFDSSDGRMLTGLQKTNGYWRYFDPSNGKMLTGLQKTNGYWRYFDVSNGRMLTGLQKTNGYWRYFDASSGRMLTGLQKTNGYWRYFDASNGRMLTGLQKTNGYWRYFDASSGRMLTGFQKVNGFTRYFDTSSGRMLTGWQKINGKWYYFNTSSGKMLTGTQKIGSKTYVFNSSGVWIK